MDKNMILWNKLLEHLGHSVTVVAYGDPDNPEDVCLECEDCGEVILDAGLYTTCARSEARPDINSASNEGMPLSEIIGSLRDQMQDRESMIDKDDPDCIFRHDAAALRAAVELLKRFKEQNS